MLTAGFTANDGFCLVFCVYFIMGLDPLRLGEVEVTSFHWMWWQWPCEVWGEVRGRRNS